MNKSYIQNLLFSEITVLQELHNELLVVKS